MTDDLNDDKIAAMVHVPVTEKTLHALQEAAGVTGLEGGAVVNRAIQMYAEMAPLMVYAAQKAQRKSLRRATRGRRMFLAVMQVGLALWGAWQAALMCEVSSIPAEVPRAVGMVMSIVVYVLYDVLRVRLRNGRP